MELTCSFFIAALYYFFPSVHSIKSSKIEKVIIDVDGGVDDIQALVMFLQADALKQIKIEAITCTGGNAKLRDVETNVIRLLETIRRTDIPVYSGSFRSFLGNGKSDLFFGKDGFGDLSHKRKPSRRLLKKLISPVFINDIVNDNPGQITIIVLGPLTNIALTLMMFPDAKDKIKKLYAMGGNYGEPYKEFNFNFDAESVNITLKQANFPITLLPWEGCISNKILKSWRFSIQIDNPVWNLVERAERKLFGALEPSTDYQLCDPILAAMVLDNTIIKNSSFNNVVMELHDSSRGELLVVDEEHGKKVKFITEFDKGRYQKYFVDTFQNTCTVNKCKSS